MTGIERRRRRTRSAAARVPKPRPSPQDLANLNGAFALTVAASDPPDGTGSVEPPAPGQPASGGSDRVPASGLDREESLTERGLRGLVGGGSSQVTATLALRARDAARPTAEDLAAAEAQLVIVRRGWVPREELPRGNRTAR